MGELDSALVELNPKLKHGSLFHQHQTWNIEIKTQSPCCCVDQKHREQLKQLTLINYKHSFINWCMLKLDLNGMIKKKMKHDVRKKKLMLNRADFKETCSQYFV